MEIYSIVNARTWRAWKELDRIEIMSSYEELLEKIE